MTHNAEIWPRIAQTSKEQNIPQTLKALQSWWFEQFHATLPPTMRKLRCATHCPKIKEDLTEKQMIWGVPQNSWEIQFSWAPLWSNIATHRGSPKRAEYATDTESIIKPMVWGVSSSCLKSTFPGNPREQSRHVLYTTNTCKICYRNREHYKRDDERYSSNS